MLGADKPPYYPILYPINWISYSTGIYMTVLLTLERYYAVCILRGTPNLKKTKIVILCVCIFAMLYNLPHFFEEKWNSEGIYNDIYPTNFYPMKTTGSGNYGVPAGKTCTTYGKGL